MEKTVHVDLRGQAPFADPIPVPVSRTKGFVYQHATTFLLVLILVGYVLYKEIRKPASPPDDEAKTAAVNLSTADEKEEPDLRYTRRQGEPRKEFRERLDEEAKQEAIAAHERAGRIADLRIAARESGNGRRLGETSYCYDERLLQEDEEQQRRTTPNNDRGRPRQDSPPARPREQVSNGGQQIELIPR